MKVRFAGQLVDGWLLERARRLEHDRQLAYLEKLVSPEPVLAPGGRPAGPGGRRPLRRHPRRRAAAGRPAPARPRRDASRPGRRERRRGRRPDRLEPRHPPKPTGPAAERPRTGRRPERPPVRWQRRPRPGRGWCDYPTGPAFLRALREGRPARAVWSALRRRGLGRAGTPRRSPPPSPAGRGAVVVVADGRDLDRLDAALTAELGTGRHVCLSAALGPAKRYRRLPAPPGAAGSPP